MEIPNPFGSFNRYWLRYGPNTVVVCLFALSYSSELRNTISNKPVLLIAVGLAGLGIQYLFTWPMLLLHAFRTDFDGAKKHAETKTRINFEKKEVENEKSKSFGELREYGNSFACVGFTILTNTTN